MYGRMLSGDRVAPGAGRCTETRPIHGLQSGSYTLAEVRRRFERGKYNPFS